MTLLLPNPSTFCCFYECYSSVIAVAWNSYIEEVARDSKSRKTASRAQAIKPTALGEVSRLRMQRASCGITVVDQVLGSGIVPGSIILLGGEPGIGKSTLLLQIAAHISGTVYITGEESLEQVSVRADRLGIKAPVQLIQETNMEAIRDYIQASKPPLVIIDSIQTVLSEEYPGVAGSIVQVRNAAQAFQIVAKTTGVPIVLVGHVTKEGTIAGPRTLEHIVDVVLSFEGTSNEQSRLLRGVKNRFGATNEVAILEMTEQGLLPVDNPSALFLSEQPENVPGSAVTCILEGRRPLLVEVQALTVPTNFGYPKRTAVGFDLNRLNILVAVLQRRAGLRLEQSDIYVNIVGGIRVADPAADLAISLAIASSFTNIALPKNALLLGELGLLGEIRPTARSADRLKEAARLGYKPPKQFKRIQDAITLVQKEGLK